MAERTLLKGVGRFFGYVSLGQSGVDTAMDIAGGADAQTMAEDVTDLSFATIGVFGGVPGAIIGGGYFIGDIAGFNEALAISRQPLIEDQIRWQENYRSPFDCMCGLE